MKGDHSMTINKFPTFAKTVATSFQAIVKAPQVYVTGIDGDALYQRYLAAFPDGTNPISRSRPSTSARAAGTSFGAPVASSPSAIRAPSAPSGTRRPRRRRTRTTSWPPRCATPCSPRSISDLYRVGPKENSFGAATTRSLDDGGRALTWDHLHTDAIPKALQVVSPDQVRGDYRTTVQVFTRGLVELAPSALDTVLALIEANNLYRGAEHKAAVAQFPWRRRRPSQEHGAARAGHLRVDERYRSRRRASATR